MNASLYLGIYFVRPVCRLLAKNLATCEYVEMRFGFSVYQSFENPDQRGVVPMPKQTTEKLLGGHGVLVCGYDDVNSWWIIRNQWGEDWGDHGYCYMPYGYESLWMEAWTATPTG
jgi:C1A family cysteine protease